MRMSTRIAVAGASGYAGGELLRLLLGHPDVEIGALTRERPTRGRQWERCSAPRAPGRQGCSRRPRSENPSRRARCGLPRPSARRVRRDRRQLGDDTVVIDCGADFRLADPAAWAVLRRRYAGTWPWPSRAPGQRDVLRSATRIAVPGCFTRRSPR